LWQLKQWHPCQQQPHLPQLLLPLLLHPQLLLLTQTFAATCIAIASSTNIHT
jgi:hypothetical protein